MRDDDAIAADLCEERGLVGPAQVLRQIADGTGEVFMVRPDYFAVKLNEISGPLVDSSNRTRRLFRTREAAETYAAKLRATLLREYSYRPLEEIWLFSVPTSEFCRQVGTILGIDYRLPGDRSVPIVPSWASDEQLRAIAPLLTDSLVEVVCIPFNTAEEA